MQTIEVTADQLRGPQDMGRYILKGDLVFDSGALWRVLSVDEMSGMLMICLREERAPSAAIELASPQMKRCPALAKTKFVRVVEDEP
jgi:hypothetical protein